MKRQRDEGEKHETFLGIFFIFSSGEVLMHAKATQNRKTASSLRTLSKIHLCSFRYIVRMRKMKKISISMRLCNLITDADSHFLRLRFNQKGFFFRFRDFHLRMKCYDKNDNANHSIDVIQLRFSFGLR